MDIKSLMNSKQAMLRSKLQVLIDHPVSKGEQGESAWIEFFRGFLPNKYAVDKGFVFDSKGGMSEQIDIIIYDALYTPLVFATDAGEKFVTAESVYAVFESKQTIDKANLEYANKKIESVRSLHRSSRGMIASGKPVGPRALTPILGGILSVNSIGSNTLVNHIKNYNAIDLGCAINDFTFHARRKKNGELLGVVSSSEDETILSFFYLILDELHKIGTIPALDIREYADATLEQFEIERGDI